MNVLFVKSAVLGWEMCPWLCSHLGEGEAETLKKPETKRAEKLHGLAHTHNKKQQQQKKKNRVGGGSVEASFLFGYVLINR